MAASSSTPRGPVKSATRDFRRQRTTALALIPLALFLIALLLALAGADYETARHYLGNPIVSFLVVLTIVSAVLHMRVGMGEVIEDYVHGRFFHVLALTANILFCVAVGLASIYAALKILIGF
jgi:succinate dehydrogenase / fumarate reductase, membrane anchor subunit